MTAFFSCGALRFADQGGADSLIAVLFFHPQDVQLRMLPAVNYQIAPSNDVSVAVGNFEYDQFIFDRIFIVYLCVGDRIELIRNKLIVTFNTWYYFVFHFYIFDK